MLSGKRGLRKQTFSSCFQTSKSFPPVLTRNKRTWLYTNWKHPVRSTWKVLWKIPPTSDAKYFESEKEFLDAKKSRRVKSHIKFSGYTMNEVSNIVEILSLKCCCPGLTMHTWLKWTDIIYYVVGFISKSVKKQLLCCKWWYTWRKLCFRNQYWRYDPRKLSGFCEWDKQRGSCYA